MKFVFALILVVFVTDVKPLFEEMSDIIFKKYATMKVQNKLVKYCWKKFLIIRYRFWKIVMVNQR